jgi:two-component system, cell cycle response regulator
MSEPESSPSKRTLAPITQAEVVTRVVTVPDGSVESDGHEPWALIRYVGHPIGELIPLPSQGLVFGRTSEADIRLPEPEVSRRHSRIGFVQDEQSESTHIELQDLGSTNGTYVNGHKIMQAQGSIPLHHGDVIRVGGHAFKLKRLDEMERHYHHAVLTQTTVDPLTGVSNRATVLHQLEKHFELSRRHRRPLAVILCDLDHFKQINDTHGHGMGDKVLQAFGSHLMTRLRGSDYVGRIGGEEFLMVLPDTKGREALPVAEDLRIAIEQEWSDSLRASCSFGIAEFRMGDTDPGALLARADVSLYRAKAAGRNRVEFDT